MYHADSKKKVIKALPIGDGAYIDNEFNIHAVQIGHLLNKQFAKLMNDFK